MASSTRSMMRRPASRISAFGSPPVRVLLPPAWMTPVTLIGWRRRRSFGDAGHPYSVTPRRRSFGVSGHRSDGDRTGTKHVRRFHRDVEHRRWRPAGGGAAVEHEGDRKSVVEGKRGD